MFTTSQNSHSLKICQSAFALLFVTSFSRRRRRGQCFRNRPILYACQRMNYGYDQVRKVRPHDLHAATVLATRLFVDNQLMVMKQDTSKHELSIKVEVILLQNDKMIIGGSPVSLDTINGVKRSQNSRVLYAHSSLNVTTRNITKKSLARARWLLARRRQQNVRSSFPSGVQATGGAYAPPTQNLLSFLESDRTEFFLEQVVSNIFNFRIILHCLSKILLHYRSFPRF